MIEKAEKLISDVAVDGLHLSIDLLQRFVDNSHLIYADELEQVEIQLMDFKLLDALSLINVVVEEQRNEVAEVSSAYRSSGSLASKRSWCRFKLTSSVRKLDSFIEAISFCVN